MRCYGARCETAPHGERPNDGNVTAMAARRVLTHGEARRFYDRMGARQDTQEFYEGPALAELIAHLDLGGAPVVLEFGCGTGKFAAQMLERMPPTATYLGVDNSGVMVALARERLAPFGARAAAGETDGSVSIDVPDAAFDRFVSNYVLDLLSETEIDLILEEAHRVLKPGGLIGLVSLTHGIRGWSRAVSWAWDRVHRLRPSLVGGCRPIEIVPRLDPQAWRIRHRSIVTPFAIPSEIVVAEKMAPEG